MDKVLLPKKIEFGENALSEAEYPKNALVVTTTPPELSSKWLDKMGIQDYMLFDKVTPEPSIDDVNNLISEYKSKNPSVLIGLGGGSSLDVVKYSAAEFGVDKILIPTTFVICEILREEILYGFPWLTFALTYSFNIYTLNLAYYFIKNPSCTSKR